ncbi:LuxR family two component transcriptional regulator [Murinocardiopsis flavida]|uniref:LuxR family two component transcriptional regulator n=1 Tax=Murinocardiopsis flavida TaxID=645275 RepID=A0A2P8DUG0_9ACTN|nr:response regulator transcription factor [Murinocardiopsis flavida]PSL00856.1 LuxR family two component transcriptional regulator [Murinocardiopsis flavida]
MASDPIRVLLAEDMHLVRGALAALISRESALSVVAEVATGDAVLPAARVHRPDVAVLDVDMPGVDGITAAAGLRAELPDCRVLILTALSRPTVVRRAMAAKADGFLAKDAPPDELADAIRAVAAGRRVLDPALAAAALAVRDNPLSAREIEVLRQAADGADHAEIAARLHLSKGTVRNYLSTIVTKLDARNRLDAVRIAAEADWL